jgi:hypothetical protein
MYLVVRVEGVPLSDERDDDDGSPHDLDLWVSRVATLATDHGINHIAVGLRELRERSEHFTKRVSFIGQFSTRKSHLVNQLLATNVVEESEVQQTRRLVTIKASAPAETTELPSFDEIVDDERHEKEDVIARHRRAPIPVAYLPS